MADVSWTRMRTFLRVAELGSVRQAAAELHVTEPAVSAAIGEVARALGVALFVKAGRGIELTEAGRTYADYARSLLGLAAEASAAVRSAEHGLVRLGAVETASETVLPDLLASFREAHPTVEVSLSVRPRDELFNALEHREIDLAIAGRPPRGTSLVTRATRANSLIAVSAPGVVSDPLTTTWLLRGPGSGTRDATVGLLANLDVAPPTLTLGTQGAVVAAARRGLGVTLVHADAVRDLLERGALVQVAIPGAPLDRPWHLVTGTAPTASSRLFAAHACDPRTAGESAFTTRTA